MTNATAITRVAVSAQQQLHAIACMERSLLQRGELSVPASEAFNRYRAVQQSRLAVCAEHFAALVPANDCAFIPTQEPEPA
ncbi:hypothetical protein [Variovorax paradoxus]|uniref:Uncharacterized protein n=1 Tax=Variovorax paradoxus (strain EPS) TaxID=595537 RepID=E6V9R6_VARPE|nr:hypothetical protein [Variovorax paradoxus]ADU36204.1 hypothetical protein Varpa_1996 [Variovorax paradoxus EPS]